MKGFIKWVVRHWKCVAGMVVSMVGIHIATTGEYQAGLNDARGIVQALADESEKLGRTLSNEEMQNVAGKWVDETYE